MTYTFTSPDGRISVDRTEEQFAAFQLQNADWTYVVKAAKQPQIQSLAAHLQEVEDATDLLVRKTLQEYNYVSIGEAAAIAKVESSIWQTEAILMCEWYNGVYEALEDYKLSAESERKTVENFIEELSKFEV